MAAPAPTKQRQGFQVVLCLKQHPDITLMFDGTPTASLIHNAIASMARRDKVNYKPGEDGDRDGHLSDLLTRRLKMYEEYRGLVSLIEGEPVASAFDKSVSLHYSGVYVGEYKMTKHDLYDGRLTYEEI